MGTSRIKAALIDRAGGVVSQCAAVAHRQHQHSAFDAEIAWDALCRVIRHLVHARPASRRVAAVIISNQRATIIPVAANGRPAGPALSWQDSRGDDAMRRFVRRFGAARFHRITGLPPSALWSLAKLLWLQRDAGPVFQRSATFALLHDYILFRLGADRLFTDASNASLTGLFDTRRLDWSDTILDAAGIDRAQLPELVRAGTQVGRVGEDAAHQTGLDAGVPLIVGGGDQQCATLGIGAIDPGQAGFCLGTAAVVSCPSDHPVIDPRRRFFCTAHVVPGRWVLEGIHNTFGGAIRWVRNSMGVISGEAFQHLAGRSQPGPERPLFLPFLAGIGSPDFDARMRGAVAGLDLSHTRADLARAILDGISLEAARILESFQHFVPTRRLIVAGGESARRLGIRILADMIGRPLWLNPTPDATLLGAAILAWTGTGEFASIGEASRACVVPTAHRVDPALDRADRQRLYRRYCALVDSLRRLAARRE